MGYRVTCLKPARKSGKKNKKNGTTSWNKHSLKYWDQWLEDEMSFWGRPILRGYVSFRECTLVGTNISPTKAVLKMIFLFPRWDMLVPWRVILLVVWWRSPTKTSRCWISGKSHFLLPSNGAELGLNKNNIMSMFITHDVSCRFWGPLFTL